MATANPTADELLAAFSYDADSGQITRTTGGRAGSLVGHGDSRGYMRVSLHGVSMMAHRVAWCLAHGQWPRGQIDHINGDKHDNRLANLRDVSPLVNSHNQHRARRINRSGTLGVSQYRSGRYVARAFIDGRRYYLGSYATREEAGKAYEMVKKLPISDFDPATNNRAKLLILNGGAGESRTRLNRICNRAPRAQSAKP